MIFSSSFELKNFLRFKMADFLKFKVANLKKKIQEPVYDERLTWEGRADKMTQVNDTVLKLKK